MSININMNPNSNEVDKLNDIEKIFMDFINQIKLCICVESDNEIEQVTIEDIATTNSSSQDIDDYLIDDASLPKPIIIKQKSMIIKPKIQHIPNTCPPPENNEDWVHLDYEI